MDLNAHPRQYITRDGWTVLAGRNNKENDILTHKMAAQNDIWFHAHGYPGSHVILRRDGRKEEPSKQSIEDAAGVAAFWSKGSLPKKFPWSIRSPNMSVSPRGRAGAGHYEERKNNYRRAQCIVDSPIMPHK